MSKMDMPDSVEHADSRSAAGRALCEAVKQLTEENKEQQWKFVDDHLKDVTKDDFSWFENVGLYDKHANMRDLAASAMADTRYEVSAKARERLRMMTTLEKHPAAKFRAAVALYVRNAPSAGVIEVLRAARDGSDKAMSDAAITILGQKN